MPPAVRFVWPPPLAVSIPPSPGPSTVDATLLLTSWLLRLSSPHLGSHPKLCSWSLPVAPAPRHHPHHLPVRSSPSQFSCSGTLLCPSPGPQQPTGWGPLHLAQVVGDGPAIPGGGSEPHSVTATPWTCVLCWKRWVAPAPLCSEHMSQRPGSVALEVPGNLGPRGAELKVPGLRPASWSGPRTATV